jgi:hypothetical protein
MQLLFILMDMLMYLLHIELVCYFCNQLLFTWASNGISASLAFKVLSFSHVRFCSSIYQIFETCVYCC